MTAEQQQAQPTMMVFRLSEGFVLDYGGYTVALTNADDLGERVRTVAKEMTGEVGFKPPEAETSQPAPQVVRHSAPEPPPTNLKEATAIPTGLEMVRDQDAGVVPTAQLETEWANARRMIAYMAAGFDNNGKEFNRKMFDAALPMFAPHLDPKEVEFELGEFLASLHEE
jgi:hypothetical protein